MPDPKFEFNREEFTLEITGLTGGWTFRNLSTVRLFDYAQLQFPSNWSSFKVGAATRIFDAHWHVHGGLWIEQSITAGLNYTLKDGTGGSLGSDTAIVQHLLDRPSLQIDLRLRVQLEGTATRGGFEGSGTGGLFLGGRF